MTSALRRRVPRPSDKDKANWLARYLTVEQQADREVFDALVSATKSIDGELLKLKGIGTKTAAVRRLQLSLTRRELRKQITGLYGDVASITKGARAKAAEAAVDATLAHESRTLARLFRTKTQRSSYGTSLRATARRNIEATVTRVLHTARPLSRNVYKARALSTGMVDKAINDALARGDSAENLAKSIHHLIDPNTPGGVSYAAKRLARTEINNAFHAQAIRDAQENPIVTHMRWHLSETHKSYPGDPCEDYALQGLFPKDAVPDKPHPNCRCFVTPEIEDDYAAWETELLRSTFEETAMEQIRQGYRDLDAMEPEPKEPSTTKASQPDGWTGPLVAKAAANASVRAVTDALWLKYSRDLMRGPFMQTVREGSRIVQTKGYRGGLSAPGKQSLLSISESLVIKNEQQMIDLGREVTARIAYAPKSTEIVFHVQALGASALERMKRLDNVSLPLTNHETTVAKAFQSFLDRPGSDEPVLFEVVKGAKVATMGDARATMGSFRILSTEQRIDPQGNKYWHTKIEQFDAREFDADTRKGERIFNHEMFTDSTSTGKPFEPAPSWNPPGKEAWEKTHDLAAQVLSGAYDAYDVGRIMQREWPNINWNGWSPLNSDRRSAIEVATYLDRMMRKYPTQTLTDIEISEKVGTAYAHVSYQPGGTSIMRFSPKYMRSYDATMSSKEHGRLTGWNTLKEGAGALTPWGGTAVHEYGHVLDATSYWAARDKLAKAIRKYYEANVRKDGAGLRKWLQGDGEKMVYKDGLGYKQFNGNAPSGYSVHKPQKSGFNEAEIIAEAFADVEFNGDKAKPVSKVVWQVVMQEREIGGRR